MKPVRGVIYAICAISVFLVVSCKSTKKVVREGSTEVKEHNEFFEKVENDAFRFETFSAKLNVSLNLPERSVSSKANLKIVKDEGLALSVQPFLGVEVFRLVINTDSILVLDRLNKQYVAENLKDMQGKLPVDFNFYNLQALFTNRLFLPGSQSVAPRDYRKFTLEQAGGNAEVKIQDAMGLRYRFFVDRENKLTATYVTDEASEYSLQWDYADFRVAGRQLFPEQMFVRLTSDRKMYGSMKLNFSKIEVDKPVDLDFSVPSRYKRITFDQVVKLLTRTMK